MFCVPFGVTANFATVSKFEESARKPPRGLAKPAFAGLFRLRRGLTKGYWRGELGSLEGKLHHFEITPIASPIMPVETMALDNGDRVVPYRCPRPL
jgi:hypothetical protein